jgi:hypothetical protein
MVSQLPARLKFTQANSYNGPAKKGKKAPTFVLGSELDLNLNLIIIWKFSTSLKSWCNNLKQHSQRFIYAAPVFFRDNWQFWVVFHHNKSKSGSPNLRETGSLPHNKGNTFRRPVLIRVCGSWAALILEAASASALKSKFMSFRG